MSDQWKVSGKRVDLPVASTAQLAARPGGWIVAIGADGRRVRLMVSEVRGKLGASLGGKLWLGEVTEKRQGSAASGGSDADLVSQFPGKVRKILVRAGAAVAEGEALVLVEAMKMEFPVKAPYAGTVAKVLVQEGQSIQPGDRFVVLTPATGGKNG